MTARRGRLRTVLSRAPAVPALVRCGVFLSALAAFVAAYPASLLAGRPAAALVLVAVWPAARPRGRGATVVVLVGVAGWLVDTTFYGRPVSLGRLLALATLLYLVHTLTALAAVLPYDAVVAVEVIAQWLARAFAVTLASAVLTVLVLGVAQPAGTGFAPVAVAGFAAAVALAGLLGWLARRP